MKNQLKSGGMVKNEIFKLLFAYTMVFSAVLLVVFSPFFGSGVSLVWNTDGTSQHFTAFVYFGNYLREIIKSLFAGSLVIPQFDLSIGLGSDILQALHYYVIGDPLNLVSVFVPEHLAVYAYTALMYFRYYLAGVAFCLLAKYKKMPAFSALAGAVLYVFTTYTFQIAIRHPSFLNPSIYFPLIIIGIEMMFEKKRPYLFTIMIFISAMSSFYFFYSVSFFTVLYIFVRLFFVYRENIVKNFFQSLIKFGGCYILGIIMASVIFVPIVLTFLSSSRGGVEYPTMMLFSKDFYKEFIDSFAGPYVIQCTRLGFTTLGIAGIVLLFSLRKKHGFLKLSFAILTVMALLPIFSKIVNGFTYVTNRWTWAYGLLVSFIFATAVSELKKIDFKRSLLLLAGAVAYFAITMHSPTTRAEGYFVTCVIFFIFAAACLIYSALPYVYGNLSRQRADKVFKCVIVGMAMLAIMCNGFYNFARSESSYISEFMKFSSAADFASANGESPIAEIQNTESAVERYENQDVSRANYNNSLITKTHGVISYFSLNSNYVNEMQKELGLVYWNYSVINSGYGDPFLQAVENVKYYSAGTDVNLAYNFDDEPVTTVKHHYNSGMGDEIPVYENKNYLPFGYTYENVISQGEYDALNPAEKRNAMLSAVVLNDSEDKFVNTGVNALDINGISCKAEIIEDAEEEETEIAEENKPVIKSNEIYAGKAADIKFRVSNAPDSQLYCIFNNLKYNSLDNVTENEDGTYTSVARYKGKRNVSVSAISSDEKVVEMNVTTPYYDYYSGIHDFTANLGYYEGTDAEITLSFSKGYYTFDSIEFVSIPMNDYSERIASLSENTMENLKIEPNRISGTITADKAEWLCLSVPYSDCWTAVVDGKETEIHRANTAFCAISLEQGEHTVEFRYSNRIVKYSAALTVIGFAGFAGVAAVWEICNKKRKKSV